MSDENSKRDTDDLAERFEGIYQNQQKTPWSLYEPHPVLVEWFERETPDTTDKRAIVTGCGEGDDAEYLAQQGYDVTAFDISPRAIEICKERFPETKVNYVVASLLDLPQDWVKGFDFVLDQRTIQSLPPEYTDKAIAGTGSLADDNGLLLIICWGRADDSPRVGTPWPLSHAELNAFVAQGFTEESFESELYNGRLFRVIYRRT